MKKITLLMLALIAINFSQAQQTISFEAPDYSLGDLNTQNGWAVTGDGSGGFVSDQVVTDEQSSDGTYSFKTSYLPEIPAQTSGPIIGGFYNFTTPIDYSTAIISYDIYVTQQDGDSSDFRFGVVGQDEMGGLFFTYYIDFSFDGNINVVNSDATAFQSIGTWNINTWYNVRAEVNGSSITYFVDDVEGGTSNLLNDYDFTSFRFVHDNYGGDAYIDNIRINDEELSLNDFNDNTYAHFYKKSSQNLNVSSSSQELNSVEIFDLLGKRVLKNSLNSYEADIDVSSLNDGIYLAKIISAQGASETFKFLKN